MERRAARAAVLADQYLGGIRPSSIRWSTRQQRRWGSCSLHSREIRIASRLQTVPEWVLDGVIVHELTHLLEAGHTARFPLSTEEDDVPAEVDGDGVAACAW